HLIRRGRKRRSNIGISWRRMRAERLREAMRALFVENPPGGRPTDTDTNALWLMAYWHHQDRAMQTAQALGYGPSEPRRIRAIRELAREAAKKNGLPANAEERLRKKFSDRGAHWLHVVRYHDDVPEQLDHGLLTQIAQ